MSDAESGAETEPDAEAETGADGEGAGEPDDDEIFDPERLAELVDEAGEYVTELKRVIVDDGEGGDIVELAQDLWAVLQELEELLETLDFEELPEAIDLEELPDAVDVEDIPEGLFDEDESAIDLSEVMEAVELRELWDAVDLTEFLQEKNELEAAVDDVTGDGGDGEGDDGMFENVVETDGVDADLSASARQAFIEEKILAAVEKFRSALLSTHDGLRKMYEKNQEKLGSPGNQPDSLNPTAASTMPGGPIPNSVSTRASTVPPQVKYSRVDTPRRIYSQRWEERRDDGDSRASEAEASAETAEEEAEAEAEEAADEAADADAEADASADVDMDADTDAAAETESDDAGSESDTDAAAETESDDADAETESDDDVPEIEVFDDDE